MKLNDVLAAMRAGAWLHLTLADGPRWQLNDGATATTVNSRTGAGMIKRGRMTGNTDSLFDIVPSQTWRYTGPKEPPQPATEAPHEDHWRRRTAGGAGGS